MRDYQRQRRNPYLLPHNVYKQVLYMTKDYDRLRAEREDILCAVPINDGMPRSSDPADQTYNKAERLSRVEDQIRAIERAVEKIPEEYRRGVWNNVLYGMPYPIVAGSATWQRWRSRYIWYVAKNAGLA